MAGYQTIEALRPILHRGPPATPVVDRALFYKPRFKASPTLAKIQRMVELRSKGFSALCVAQEVGFSESTVRRLTAHVPPPLGGWPRGGVQGRIDRPKAERMRRAGFTYKEIGEEFGVNKETARCFLLKLGRSGKSGRSGPRRPTFYCEVVVSRVTGFERQSLVRTGKRGGGNGVGVARARVILSWLCRHRLRGMSYSQIASCLGGYDPTTVGNAYARVCSVAAALDLKLTGKPENVVRRIWEAEWPKAPR